MKNKALPLKEISVSELYNGSNKMIFEVPVYQRNYAWEKDEISALIQDVYDACIKGSDVYFIGTLVTFNKGDNVYEVIDGQQRLTTINLILNALHIKPNNPLTYKARKKSNNTIKHIPSFDIDEKDHGIVNGFKYAETSINEKIASDDFEAFKTYFQNNVHIIHYEVPRDIDLNHYFEIMNSRGEQLEKHEIVKARLISYIKNDYDKSTFNFIWECCSEMGVYVQQKYKEKDVFGPDLCELIVDAFEQLPFTKKDSEEQLSINALIESEAKYELKNPNISDDKPDSFQPVIDFQNFLLIVLKITRITNEHNFNPISFNLDDKELINEFEKVACDNYGGKESFAKNFAYNLLKIKYLLDNYVVHHSNEEDTIENNPWKLQYWQYNTDKKKGPLRSLCSDEELQHKLVQLLSMFEVSFTARQRKNYLFYCLLFLFEKYNSHTYDEDLLPEYGNFVEALAKKYFCDVYLVEDKLNNINTPKPGSFDEVVLCNNKLNVIADNLNIHVFEKIYGDGTVASKGVPLFIFNYLDYKLWEYYAENLRGEKLKEKSPARQEFFNELGCSDFGLDVFNQFYFSRTRRSLEHYYPQANITNSTMDDNQINCLGNYAMIGSAINSAGSNWSPKTKLDCYLDTSGKIKQVSVASLKFMIMMQKCKDEDRKGERNPGCEWIFEDIKEHQKKMLKFFEK